MNDKFNGCELLCPAGSFESMKTALHFGADAVYAGGPFMQLRSDNAGFSYDDIIKAVELVHGKGKKIYDYDNGDSGILIDKCFDRSS